jgi:hypothetical protein
MYFGRWRRRRPGRAAPWAGIRPATTSSSRSTNTVSPSLIGFRASDAVVMAGLRDHVPHRGGRASAAAPMAGTASESRGASWWACHQCSAGRGPIAPVKPPGWWPGQGRPSRSPLERSPWSAIGIRASAAVLMADPRDPCPHRGGRASAAARVGGGLRVDRGDPVVLCSTVACRPVRALSKCCPQLGPGWHAGTAGRQRSRAGSGAFDGGRGGQQWR